VHISRTTHPPSPGAACMYSSLPLWKTSPRRCSVRRRSISRQRIRMNRQDLIDAVASRAGTSKAALEEASNAELGNISHARGRHLLELASRRCALPRSIRTQNGAAAGTSAKPFRKAASQACTLSRVGVSRRSRPFFATPDRQIQDPICPATYTTHDQSMKRIRKWQKCRAG
jgi:hypothetical protein